MGFILAARNPHLVFSGDSMAVGVGGSSPQTRWPSLVANAPARGQAFVNMGLSGESSTVIRTAFATYSADLLSGTHFIWGGRNNYTDPEQVKSDIAAIEAMIPHERYLVLSITNGEYPLEYAGESRHATMLALNADLAAAYGERFVDVRTPLVAAGAPGGVSPNPTDYAHDIPPAGIRSDELHLLDAGQAIVAATVTARRVALGF